MFTPSREYIQALSTALLLMGLYLMTVLTSGWTGVSLVGLSCWVMLMSESILLSKVQGEMSSALESLRKKQELEVQDLLYYLRQSKLGDSPWSSVEAAKNHIENLGLPAIITDPGGMCLAVNQALTDTLGYGEDFVGQLCHTCQRADLYGEYVQGIQSALMRGDKSMHTRIVMLDISGNEHTGTIALIFLADMRSAVGIWLPDDLGILTKV